MNIESGKIDRLLELSHKKTYDPYTRFDWPDNVATDRLWCNEDLLTTFGTPLHAQLDDQHLYELSKWEAINFFSLNVHGIKTVLEFVCQCFYKKRYEGISQYLHVLLAEENSHMWFFAKFCLQYGNKIYPSNTMKILDDTNELEHDLYLFISTLVFEEFVDYYNRRVGLNHDVADIVREINHQHHQDESRHVAFGREVVKELYCEITDAGAEPEDLERIARTTKGIIGYFVGQMYNASVYKDAGIADLPELGFKNAAALRNNLRNAPERKPYHSVWFNNTANYLEKLGIVENTQFLAMH